MKIGFVSIYPPKGALYALAGGVASYTKNLANSVPLSENDYLLIFANKIGGKTEMYSEDGIRILRCWDKNALYPIQLIWNIFKERKNIDVIHIQHEYFLYGNALSASVFPLFLLLLKILRRPIIVTLHGIIPLLEFNKDFMEQNRIKGNVSILRYGIRFITKLISSFSNIIIVHDKHLKNALVDNYNVDTDKILVVPHGIEEKTYVIPKKEAKRLLGVDDKNILLFFGYISGYKGLETLISSFEFLDNDMFLLFIAGGGHPRMKDNQNYNMYINYLKDMARRISDNIIFTGFVPEDKIPFYFSAADLVILPYTIGMSSSGPLTFAITYNCPFLVSEAFKESIAMKEIIFKRDPVDLAKKIEEVFSNAELHRRLLDYGKALKDEMGWSKIGEKTYATYLNLYRPNKLRD